ncbi:hypothetical protein T4D_12433 [Trichinella pseudospiralis]|uniref:Uncharacterized protein n=1 Tax=Trichinella pseudospiralis TaxID=6337 RepID=A0A0V1DUA6_TRIPS|nr:hypothetical protein T4D_12433 [Trichinella pseudospiralis]
MPSKLRFAYVNTQRSCQFSKSISSNLLVVRKTAKNVFSKLGLFLIDIPLY